MTLNLLPRWAYVHITFPRCTELFRRVIFHFPILWREKKLCIVGNHTKSIDKQHITKFYRILGHYSWLRSIIIKFYGKYVAWFRVRGNVNFRKDKGGRTDMQTDKCSSETRYMWDRFLPEGYQETVSNVPWYSVAKEQEIQWRCCQNTAEGWLWIWSNKLRVLPPMGYVSWFSNKDFTSKL